MIHRALKKKLLELTGYCPVVVVTGPRQSGKTALCLMCSPEKPYVFLETLDTRGFALGDPRSLKTLIEPS